MSNEIIVYKGIQVLEAGTIKIQDSWLESRDKLIGKTQAIQKIDCQDTYDSAAFFLKKLTTKLKAIEKDCKKLRDPYFQTSKNILATGKEGWGIIESEMNRCKKIMADYILEEEKKAKEEEERIAQEALKKKLEAERIIKEAEEKERKLKLEEERKQADLEKQRQEAIAKGKAEEVAKLEAEKLKSQQEADAKQAIIDAEKAENEACPFDDLIEPEETGIIKVDTSGSRVTRKYKFMGFSDEDKVPAQFRVPSEKLIKEAIKNGTTEIEGCIIEYTTKVSAS